MRLSISLRDVVAQCRDAVVANISHYRHTTTQAKRGEQVTPNTLTTTFKKKRDKCGLTWEKVRHQLSMNNDLYPNDFIENKELIHKIIGA